MKKTNKLKLWRAKRKAISEQRKLYKSGKITKVEFKKAKDEIKTYVDY